MWTCLECGWTFASTKAAERAAFGDDGCPGCGGSDVDFVTSPSRPLPKRKTATPSDPTKEIRDELDAEHDRRVRTEPAKELYPRPSSDSLHPEGF